MNRQLLEAMLYDHKIRKKLPTVRERDVIQYVKTKEGAFSLDTAHHFCITQQSAGQLLRSAYLKGYLRRKRSEGPAGETRYQYYFALEDAHEQRASGSTRSAIP